MPWCKRLNHDVRGSIPLARISRTHAGLECLCSEKTLNVIFDPKHRKAEGGGGLARAVRMHRALASKKMRQINNHTRSTKSKPKASEYAARGRSSCYSTDKTVILYSGYDDNNLLGLCLSRSPDASYLQNYNTLPHQYEYT
ncbi:hypothetical protein Mapa_012599 [Marchantia paleacea]|nr:hypothetical protein Mapa_012599 [Marchantia paleacea]